MNEIEIKASTEIKPGYKTSEFWSKIIVQVVMTLVLLGYIPEEQGNQLTAVLLWLLSVAIPEMSYIYGRSLIKVAQLNARPKIVVQQIRNETEA